MGKLKFFPGVVYPHYSPELKEKVKKEREDFLQWLKENPIPDITHESLPKINIHNVDNKYISEDLVSVEPKLNKEE